MNFVSCTLATCIVGSMALLASGCETRSARGQETAPIASGPSVVKFDPTTLERLGVRVAPAGSGDGTAVLNILGTLEYDVERYAEVGTPLAGRTTEVPVRVGDRDKKGQRLALLHVPEVASLQADLLTAEASAHAAREHATREKALRQKELTTAREAEVAASELVRAEASLQAASARLRVLGLVSPATGTVITQAGTLPLVAPIDGLVVRRDVVVGRFMEPRETAFAIADPSVLRATLDVHEADLPYFAIGADVTMTFDAAPGKTANGRVAMIEPTVGKASRAAIAHIVVPNEAGDLRPGLFVRARLSLPESVERTGVVVPKAAVQPLGSRDVVFVEASAGTFEVRSVKVGRETAQIAEIVEGITKGDRIAVAGTFLLRAEVTRQ